MTFAPAIRATYEAAFPGELVVDNFAGGGGASLGIERATRRPVDIAINHSPAAIAMHKANHPNTRHYCENIWEVSPREVASGRKVGFAWFSPDCTHHSRAKGSKPREHGIRALAWVVVNWAREVGPRVIMLENVEEFADWGPLDAEGRPIPDLKGETFRAWLAALTDLGYHLDFRSLVAADYGTPTIRRRLFLIARRDGAELRWPDATHGEGRPQAWRPAREVIDWSIPCPSIFERKRPLAENTKRRIVAGIRRFVIEAQDPCVVFPTTHQGDARAHSSAEPFRTITSAHRGELAIAEPFLAPVKSWGGGGNGPRSLSEPMRTIIASKRGEHALVCPIISKHYGGEHPNGMPKAYGSDVELPLSTITTKDHHYLTSAFITKYYGTSRVGADARDPLPTITTGGGKGGGHLAAVQVDLARGDHHEEVRAFLVKYYGAGGRAQTQGLDEPLHTVMTRDRFGIVVIHGVPYAITDIGMRMLQPHELFAANGFPDDYVIRPDFKGKPMTKTDQVALCGNAVCPQVAEHLVEANAA